ncbi:MAG TPA: hypothetical protein VFU22_08505 [Roseiflexaceae bacterium]|nr:hypothetical protein [Roseiflexaceae bacterium]
MKTSIPDLRAHAGPRLAPWPTVVARPLAWRLPLLVCSIALLHGLLYLALLPPWQAPDEPALFEYAALTAALGRVPTAADRDLALERRIAESLTRQRFFEYVLGHPAAAPDLEAARALFFMPRQVGSDPPLYFVLAALPLSLLRSFPIEQQLLALRLLGVMMTAGTVLCAYAAACEFRPRRRGFAIAVALVLVLQPMFVFIGASAGNDSLANLIGAALCWLVIRLIRCGFSFGRAAALLLLLLAGGLTKRTLLPELLLLGLLGLGWTIARAVWAAPGMLARIATAALTLLALGAGVSAAVVFSRADAFAADWVIPLKDVKDAPPSPRLLQAPGSGQPALELPPGLIALQPLPDVESEWAQNQAMHFRAHVWTARDAGHGVIAIDFGWAKTEIPFETDPRGRVAEVATFVPLYAPYLHVLVRSERGTIYADQLVAESDRRPGLNMLSNSDLAAPALRAASALARLSRYLRWRELAWAWRSERLLEPPPLGRQLLRIFFVSFWGQFGWMSLPLVGGTPWEGALALICLGGVCGSTAWLAAGRGAAWQRRAAVVLGLIVVAEGLFPLFYSYTQPRSQAIQQGRYCFPALAPIALLLVLGWRALLPSRWRTGALIVGVAFGALFSVAALQLIVGFYRM